MMRTMAISAYIQSIEEKLVGEGHGWEHFLKNMRKEHPIKGQFEGCVEAVAWGLTVIGSFAAFLYALIYL